MKKLLLCLLLCTMGATAYSQDIYNEVKKLKRQSETTMNDTTLNIETRKIACFKNDALYYLIDKAGDDNTFTEYQLGVQANAMIDFVNLFVKRLSEVKKKQDKELILAKYRAATIQNALFNDMDKDIVYGYVDNENYLTQFSLDTDWVKALEEVKK